MYRVDRPCFAWQELGVDEGDDTTLGYDYVTKKFVQSVINDERKFCLNGAQHILLVISDGKLEVARDNTLFLKNFKYHDEHRCPSNTYLVITRSISSKLKNLSSKVLQDCRKVH